MVLMLCVGITIHAKVYLVAVGISDYSGNQNDLHLCAKDAKTIAWLYSKNSDVDCVQLLDAQATVTNITNAMRTTFVKATADDIVVFFYSGHGYSGGFRAYDAKMSYDKVRDAMAKSKSKNKMIFADACYSGQIRTNNKKSSSAESKAKKSNVMLFLSSRGNETSREFTTMENGLFTTCLVSGLRGGADANKDRTITARELFDFVHTGVIKMSKDKQHPVMWGNFPDNMTIMKW